MTPQSIQRTLPEGLTIDTWEGRAFIGVVPFFMNRVRPALLPALPWLSYFMDLNVRTYVHDRDGNPGVSFYSLDGNLNSPCESRDAFSGSLTKMLRCR